MTKTIPVSEARGNLSALVTQMQKEMNRIIITRNGKPEAVMIGFEEYEDWIETLELMSRPETVKGIREGLADLKRGDSMSFEDLFGEPLSGKTKKR